MPGMNTRSPRHEPIMMIRPPVFRCLSAACVATKTPRTLIAKHAIEVFERRLLERLSE